MRCVRRAVMAAALCGALVGGCGQRALPNGDAGTPLADARADVPAVDAPPLDVAVDAPAPDLRPVDAPPECVRDGDCTGGRVCTGNRCVCPGALTFCAGACVDTGSSTASCGACGHACAAAERCAAGACVQCLGDGDCGGGRACRAGQCVCPPPQTPCGATCADLASDRANCGGCANACAGNAICSNGGCLVADCVVDKDCGGYGTVCAAGACVCRGGLTSCGDFCADLAIDTWNCGACHAMCYEGWVCAAGACQPPPNCRGDADCGALQHCLNGVCNCPTPYEMCGADCVDTSKDARHCGACGAPCGAGSTCVARRCVAAPACRTSGDCPKGHSCSGGQCVCPTGLVDCGATCAALASDPTNCGACGTACGDPAKCVAGKCARKRGDVLETHPLPVAGDPLLGIGSAGSNVFWGNLTSAATAKFDVQLGTVYRSVDNPDGTGARLPHGVETFGRSLYFGLFKASSGNGPSGLSDLVHYRFADAGGTDAVNIVAGRGGACTLGPGDNLYVFQNPGRKILILDPGTLIQVGSLAASGFDAADVVYDMAYDGAVLWTVGLRYAGSTVTGSFVKIVDPKTGALVAAPTPPDPAWLTGAAYDGANIWMAGKTTLFRVQP